jgi:tetratricopeptide (TPR) repeat protein
MGEEITAVTDMPTLREPRVAGSRGAMVDVRAVGRPPRIAASDEIEGIDSAEIIGEDEPASASEGLSVMFERGSSSAPRVTKAAPQLTEEVEGELTEPVDRITLRRSPVVEETRVQAALDEAQHQARRGDLARSIQAFTDALEMRPTLVDAFIGRGRCHLELGDYSSAMSDFARAEDLNPDRPDPHVAMGDLYFARKEYKRAIEFYDQAVEIDGSHAMARCRRGISHYYRKNYRQAYQDLQRALALDPEIPNMRKYVQMAQKKLERGE